MKNLLAFMKPNSTNKGAPSSTPITDRSLEQWGARTVVDAKVCRKLEEELTQARDLLTNLAEGTLQKGLDAMTAVRTFMGFGKKDEDVRAFRTKLNTPLPTSSKLTPEKLDNVKSAIQNNIRQETKERIRAYVNRQKSQGKVVTIQKVQNSFSPEYPPKALVQEILKELGV